MTKKTKGSSRKGKPAATKRGLRPGSVNARLQGDTAFTCGPYKDTHVAHVYASQIRKRAGDGWTVKTNTDKNTVRVSPTVTANAPVAEVATV